MADTPSCPNDPRRVSDRQVDTLTGFILRSDLGTSQPSDDAWNRIQTRIVLGDAPITPPIMTKPPVTTVPVTKPLEPPLAWRVQRALLTTAPRLSSVGAALALLIMFVNSSLGLIDPAVLNGQPEQIIHPPDSTSWVLDRIEDRNPSTVRQDDWNAQPIILRMAPLLDESPAPMLPAEDPSTLVPPQSISQNERAVWSAMPDTRNYHYVGTRQR